MTGDARHEAVTDPVWEQELRAGMEADGEVGSVEPELAIARLLRHAHAPAELGDAREGAIWREIADRLDEVAPVARPWWRRAWSPLSKPWIWGPAVAMAAVAVLVLVNRPVPPSPDASPAEVARDAREKKSMAAQLEGQFVALAPTARASVARRVDASRGEMRSTLLAQARALPTGEGAP